MNIDIKPFQEYEGYWLHNQLSIYLHNRAIIVGELALPLAQSGNFRGKILEFNGDLWLALADGIENAKGCTLTFRNSGWIAIGN